VPFARFDDLAVGLREQIVAKAKSLKPRRSNGRIFKVPSSIDEAFGFWQWDCASRSSQKPKASSIELGTLKIRPLVVMRTTALRTRGERPNCASLETSFTSQERQMACCGRSGRRA